MPRREFTDHIGNAEISAAQQHEQVEQQVRRFVAQRAGVTGDRSQCRFDTFLANLLRASRRWSGEQFRDVAGGGVSVRACGNQCLKLIEPRMRRCRPVETRRRAEMAGRAGQSSSQSRSAINAWRSGAASVIAER